MTKLARLEKKVRPAEQSRLAPVAPERIRGRAGMQQRDRILERDHYVCKACRRAGRITAATDIDHIVPLHQGGSNDDRNLQALCRECHAAKSSREQLERS